MSRELQPLARVRGVESLSPRLRSGKFETWGVETPRSSPAGPTGSCTSSRRWARSQRGPLRTVEAVGSVSRRCLLPHRAASSWPASTASSTHDSFAPLARNWLLISQGMISNIKAQSMVPPNSRGSFTVSSRDRRLHVGGPSPRAHGEASDDPSALSLRETRHPSLSWPADFAPGIRARDLAGGAIIFLPRRI